jgi:hypothetical protein
MPEGSRAFAKTKLPGIGCTTLKIDKLHNLSKVKYQKNLINRNITINTMANKK